MVQWFTAPPSLRHLPRDSCCVSQQYEKETSVKSPLDKAVSIVFE